MLIEGASTGGSPGVTGTRVGNYMARRGDRAWDPDDPGKDLRRVTNISQRLERRGRKKEDGGTRWTKNFYTGISLGMKAETRRRARGKTRGPWHSKEGGKEQPLN